MTVARRKYEKKHEKNIIIKITTRNKITRERKNSQKKNFMKKKKPKFYVD
jgi:hypothetical protein